MAYGKKTGGGSRKGIPNKNRKQLAAIVEAVISTEERMRLLALLARGVPVEETLKSGETKIYSKPPDALAIRQLNEYQYGKPTEMHELENADKDKPFRIVIVEHD